jgi:adenylate cyclase
MDNDGVVDKFVGDETIGLFIPVYSGPDHARKAVSAARSLLERAGRQDASSEGPIPVGAAVHMGVAFVGTVGSSDEISDFTALGDPVNTTARLASLASAGELLVSVAAGERAGLDLGSLARRTVDVRGREAALDVVAVQVTAPHRT